MSNFYHFTPAEYYKCIQHDKKRCSLMLFVSLKIIYLYRFHEHHMKQDSYDVHGDYKDNYFLNLQKASKHFRCKLKRGVSKSTCELNKQVRRAQKKP